MDGRRKSLGGFSPVVAGTWRMANWGMSVKERVHWIEQCIESGITTFDHADVYGGYTVEGLFGEALLDSPALRQRMQLVSKCGIRVVSPARPAHAMKSYDVSSAHIAASVDASLRALNTDHLDLLLLHRPDPLMDPDEVADTFARLRDAGKVLRFGVSNHTPGQLAMLHRRFPLVTNQVELSALRMDALADGTLDQCTDLDLQPMIWSPLAGGRLFDASSPRSEQVRAAMQGLAEAHGVSIPVIAFAWILMHPSHPVPITGSRRIEAMREAVAALDVRLTREDWFRVWSASAGRDVA